MSIKDHRTWTGRAARITSIVLAVISVMGCAGIPYLSVTAGTGPPKPIPPDASSARLQAMVFEVWIPDDRIAGFDAGAIGRKKGTAEDFQKALEDFGETKVLYRVDQAIGLKEEVEIVIKNKVPVVSSRRLTAGGQTVNTVRYEDVGVIFHFLEPSKQPGPQGGHTLDVELAAMTERPTEITPGMSAKSFRNINMFCSGLTDFGKPYVMTSIDSASKDEDQMSVAYVCRVILDPVQ